MSSGFRIPRDTRQIDYSASAGQTAFRFPYPVLEEADVACYRRTVAGTFVKQTFGGGYLVTIATDRLSATVTLTTPAASLEVIRLRGERIASRTSDLAPAGANFRPALEVELDAITLTQQELARDTRLYDFIDGTYDTGGRRLRNLGAPVELDDAARLRDINDMPSAGTANSPWGQLGPGAVLRTVTKKLEEIISLEDYGGNGNFDGTTGAYNEDAWQRAFDRLFVLGGGKLRVGPGRYLQNAQAGLTTIPERGIEIEMDEGAVVVAATNFNDSLFRFGNAAKTPQAGSLVWERPQFDLSRGRYVVGDASCTAIETYYLRDVHILRGLGYAGDVPKPVSDVSGTIDVGADSFHADVGTLNVQVRDGRFRGFKDTAFYPGGDNVAGVDASEGTNYSVTGALFELCNNACSPKREAGDIEFSRNVVVKSRGGLVPSEIVNVVPGVGSVYTGPPRRVTVDGNRFRQVMSNAIRCRGPGEYFVANNVIEDIGYDHLGNAPVSASYGTVIQGAQRVSGGNNRYICGVALPKVASLQRAIFVDNATLLDAVYYQQGRHHFVGDMARGVGYYVTELATGGAGLPSSYLDANLQCDVAIAVGLNASSVITYTTDGSTNVKALVGSTGYDMARFQFSAAVDVSLASIGTLAAGTQTGTLTVTVTGAAVGDEVIIVRNSASLAVAPSQIVSARAVADGVQYVWRNTLGAGFDYSAQTMRVIVRRP